MSYGSAPYGSTTYGQQAVILPTIVGSMNQTLASVAFSSATAADQVSGSLTKTLEAVTGTSLVLVNAVAAVLTKTLVDIAITSGSGAVALAATLTKTFVDLIRTLQLQGSIDSALSKTLAFLGLSADGIAYARTGNLVALLADVLATAMQGAGAISGTLTKTLNTFLGSNLVQNSKFAGSSGLPYDWSAYSTTPTITYGQTDPNGGTDAISWDYKDDATTGIMQVNLQLAVKHRFTSGTWLRADAPTTVRLGAGSNSGSHAVTTTWQFFNRTGQVGTTQRSSFLYTSDADNPGLANGSKIYVAFPQANYGDVLMAYEDSNALGHAAVAVAGTATVVLASLTTTAQGAISLAGTLSRTLGALSGSLLATLGITGTLSRTFDALGRTLLGGPSIAASLVRTLGDVTLAPGIAGSFVTGALTKTLEHVRVASSWVKAARRRIMMMTRSRRPNGL